MSEQLALLPGYLTAHLQLTLFALLAGTLLSLPLGIAISRARRFEQTVLGLASVIQTIPSLALLAIMVPALAAVGFPSIGFLPALIGLTLYSVLPILRNTVTGLTGLDPAVLEAARGVGMTPSQQLRRVELPLALPVVLAGLRTSTVWTVGIATLSTPVGAPSLGNYIFTGLQTRNLTAVLVGCVASAALALALDALVWSIGTSLIGRRRGPLLGAVLTLALLFTYSTATFVSSHRTDRPARLVIGAKTFTEQYVLAEIIAQHLRARTGRPVEVLASLGSTVAFDALRAGEIDAYVDYSGTIWTTVMKRTDRPPRDVVLAEMRAYLADRDGVQMVGALGFENAYALAMRAADAAALGVTDIGDLTPHAPRLTIGGDYEFFGRPEWSALQGSYGLAFRDRRSMDSSLMYQALANGQVDVISAFSTDGRIEALDLVVLQDGRRAIPPYDAVLLAGARLAVEHPAVIGALAELAGTIDAPAMRRMNLAVDAGGRSPASVAAAFLQDAALARPAVQ